MDRASTSSEPPRCPGMRAISSNPRLFDANAVRPGHALPACLALPPSRARPRFCYGLRPRARISPPATGTDGLPPQGAGRHWNRGGSLSAPGAHGIRACAPEMPARGARERVPERSGPFRDGGPARERQGGSSTGLGRFPYAFGAERFGITVTSVSPSWRSSASSSESNHARSSSVRRSRKGCLGLACGGALIGPDESHRATSRADKPAWNQALSPGGAACEGV